MPKAIDGVPGVERCDRAARWQEEGVPVPICADDITGASGDSDHKSKLENFSTIDGAGGIIGTEDAPLKLINEVGGFIIAEDRKSVV